MFDRSKLESLRDVSVTRIGDTLSYGFPQTVFEPQEIIFQVLAENKAVFNKGRLTNRCCHGKRFFLTFLADIPPA